MVEFLSPGVFITEIDSPVQAIEGVSTSNMGIAGFTLKGPAADKMPRLVTSFEQFNREFGGFTNDSFLPLSVAGFFQNGGRRAYVQRVVPADATLAEAKIQSLHTDDLIETGDGTTVIFTKTSVTTTLPVNGEASPIVPGSFSLRWRAANASASAGRVTFERDGITALVTDGVSTFFEGRIVGVGALGTLDFTGVFAGPVVDGDSFTLDDGVHTQLFEYDVSGTLVPTAGSIVIDYATGFGAGAITDDATLAAATAAAIRSTTYWSAEDITGDIVNVYTLTGGTAGNVTTWTGALSFTNVSPAVVEPTGGLASASVDEALHLFEPDTLVLNIGAITVTLSTKIDTWTYASAATYPGTGTDYAIVDTRTGLFSLQLAAAGGGGEVVNADFQSLSDKTATDDGSGALTGDLDATPTSPNAINYDTGAYVFETDPALNQTPHGPAGVGEGSPILATYEIDAWDMNPVSAGTWGNDLRVVVSGNVDSFTAATGTYTLFDVSVQQYNASTGGYDVIETYEALDFADSTSAQYFADVINELSDYIRITEPAGDEPPLQLSGISRSRVIAAGDATTAGESITVTLGEPAVQPRSVSITWTDSTDVARTISDDGNGNLTGDIDVTGNNTITYSTGAIDVRLSDPIKVGTLVTCAYYTAPTASSTTDFGDTTQLTSDGAGSGAALPTVSGSVAWVSASNGTFDSTNYGRNQFSVATLETTNEGIYGFNKVEEILQVVVPDFAGDVTITRDLLDYADGRALQSQGADRFVILTVPQNSDPQESVDWFRFDLQRFSKYAAIYAPWINVADPLADNRPLSIPPMGHVAGIYARTDNAKNVSKAPGGTIDGQLRGLLSLEQVWTQGQRDLVYPNKINPLVSSTATGLAVWGVRTISNQTEWRYVNVVRLFQFVELSIWRDTQWIVFESNNAALRLRIRGQLTGFLNGLFSNGYFAGARPNEAFSVVCDDTNNPPDIVDQGIVIIDVAIAPLKPAEYVQFRFSQKSVVTT